MQAVNEPALPAARGNRAMSSDALAKPKRRQIRQSLPVAYIGQFTHVKPTECPDFRKRKNS